MKRVHVFEFEDFSWFPSGLRTCMTHNLVILARLLGVGHALGQLLAEALEKTRASQIVDLGSGSGGVLPEILGEIRLLAGRDELSLLLSDRFPNPDALRHFNAQPSKGICYCEEPVDATLLGTAPDGLKTMVNSFHHLRPREARAMLASAVEHRQPILIYELGGHQVLPFWVWLLGLPIALPLVFLSALVISSLVRPVTARQLLFTYLVPLIPLFYAWDGQASMARIYRDEDLDALLLGLEDPGYSWEKGHGYSKRGGKLGSYLLGLPVQHNASQLQRDGP